MPKPIPVNIPVVNGNEAKYLQECIDTGWISSEGPFVRKFEGLIAGQVKRKFGIAVANGTAALEVAVAALGIGPGDEVILPAFTIISCASAIVRAGAVPVVVDCDPKTWNMDVSLIQEKITEKTKAIMVVHIYGLPVDMDPVLTLAKENKLYVIEDAAEALGQTYKGQPCGSFGDLSTFSFYPNKFVTTGEGGMVLANSPELAEKCRSLRNLCFQQERRFVHEELGFNYRLNNLSAAVGVAQFERLPETLQKKKEIGDRYNSLLSEVKELQLPLGKTSYAENVYWVYGVVVKEGAPLSAAELMGRLRDEKIGTRPFFWPMNKQPVFQKMGLFQNVSCPTAERIAKQGFYVPSGVGMSLEEVEIVAEKLKVLLRG